jgi:bifunctional DNase/RNase
VQPEFTRPDEPGSRGAPGALVVCDVERVYVRLPEPHARAELVSREPGHPGQLAVPMSIEQARALQMARERLRTPRPFTHDLIAALLEALGATVVRAVIASGDAAGLVATLSVMGPDRSVRELDARPSDALIVCLRSAVPAPILVDAALLEPL